jgi:predicted ribosome quality control (RQC) complex YloA/Tae2 family protein
VTDGVSTGKACLYNKLPRVNLLLLHLFAHAVGERLRGAALGTPTWLRPVLSVPVRGGDGRSHLVAILETPGPFVFLADEPPLKGAPERFGTLAGRRITAVRAKPGDRILCIEAGEDASSDPLELQLHLYGARGGAQLVRGESTLESLGTRRQLDAAARGRSLVDADVSALEEAVAEGDPRAIRSVLPGVDDDFLAAFTDTDSGFDAAAAVAFRDGLMRGDTPFRVATGRCLAEAVPVPADAAEGSFDSAVDAARAVGDAVLGETTRAMVASLARPIRRRIASSRKLLENLHGDLEKASGHERVRREAETLAAFQSNIPPGVDSIDLPDVYDPDSTLVIELDPSLPVSAQIEKRFRRATKLEKSEVHARRRIELVESEMLELESALSSLEEADSISEVLERVEAAEKRFDIPARASDKGPRKPPDAGASASHRRFDVGEGWFVLVGRNNRDNDELTFHTAAPTDLWFHAQSVPGSHVVLKSSAAGAPPSRIVDKAAAIAAHFSRARHSALVPVIYTQRKYVRKFRGARPGQVRCEREKMLMVAPALPEEHGE